MCDHIKDVGMVRKQLQTAIDNQIEIIEVEFISGAIRFRDVGSVQRIINRIDDRVEEEKASAQIYKPTS